MHDLVLSYGFYVDNVNLHKAPTLHVILLKSVSSLIPPEFLYSPGALALHDLWKDFNTTSRDVWVSVIFFFL